MGEVRAKNEVGEAASWKSQECAGKQRSKTRTNKELWDMRINQSQQKAPRDAPARKQARMDCRCWFGSVTYEGGEEKRKEEVARTDVR